TWFKSVAGKLIMPAGTVSSGDMFVAVVKAAGTGFVRAGAPAVVGAGIVGEGTSGLMAPAFGLPGIGSLVRGGNAGKPGAAAGTVGATALVLGGSLVGFITTLVLPSTASRSASSTRESRFVLSTGVAGNTGGFWARLPTVIPTMSTERIVLTA